MLDSLFISIFNMSLSASFIIALVLMARILLKRVPKIFSYILWVAVLIRLVCPFAVESNIGILPYFNIEVNEEINEMDAVFDYSILSIDTVNQDYSIVPVLQEVESSGGINKCLPVVAIIWMMGILVVLGNGLKQYILLKKRVLVNVPLEDEENVYLVDGIETAFVLGVMRPEIYMPSGLEGEERNYILAHEKCHIRRRDYKIRFIAFLILAIHWFNPMVWIAFTFLGRDMEMSCDEAVLKKMNGDMRIDYASSLLCITTENKNVHASPLAFGLCDTKVRIQNVLKYKNPKTSMIVFLIPIIVILLLVLSTNSKNEIVLDENGVVTGNTINYQEYYQMDDGTWTSGARNYLYKLEVTGRLNGAACDSTYIILSNRNNITFEQAWKAGGLSSNTADYFDPEDAVIVECILQ